MAPAHQRLEPAAAPGEQIELGLIHQEELLIGEHQRFLQLVTEALLALHQTLQAAVVEGETSGHGLFQRLFGVGQQLAGFLAVFRTQDDADTRLDQGGLIAGQGKGRFQRLEAAVGHQLQGLRRDGMLE